MAERNQPKVSTEKILDWLEGRLSSDEINSLRTKMTATDEASLSWYETLLERLRMAVFPPVPEELEEAIRALYKSETPSVWKQIRAVLSYDSWNSDLRGALIGVRSPQPLSDMRQLMFRSNEYNLVLDVILAGGKYDLEGQIIPNLNQEEDIFVVQLVQGEQSVEIVSSDDIGEFEIADVLVGVYQLVCSGENDELVVPLDLTN